MAYKVSYFWKQQSSRLGGWTENYWNNADSFLTAGSRARNLKPYLDLCHGASTYVTGFRLTELDAATGNPKFRYTDDFEYPNLTVKDEAQYGDSDYPTTALQLLFKNSTTAKTRQWLRGIRDDCISSSGRYNSLPALVGKIDPFVAQLTLTGSLGQGWCIRKIKAANEYKNIKALTVATGVVNIPAHLFGAPGTVIDVRLKGFTLPEGVNKIWSATITDADNITLNFAASLVGQTVFVKKKATARLMTYELLQINTASAVRSTAHYTGRPTGLLGGRR